MVSTTLLKKKLPVNDGIKEIAGITKNENCICTSIWDEKQQKWVHTFSSYALSLLAKLKS